MWPSPSRSPHRLCRRRAWSRWRWLLPRRRHEVGRKPASWISICVALRFQPSSRRRPAVPAWSTSSAAVGVVGSLATRSQQRHRLRSDRQQTHKSAAGDKQKFFPSSRTLGELAGAVDDIVIDMPPLLALSETAVAARFGDSFILATRWQRTETAAAAEAAAQLGSAVGSKFVGFVLTFVDPKRYRIYGRDEAAGYYRHYRKYYVH